MRRNTICDLCGQTGERCRVVEVPEDIVTHTGISQTHWALCRFCVATLAHRVAVTRTAAKVGCTEADVEQYLATRGRGPLSGPLH